jgi:hypothetical protein
MTTRGTILKVGMTKIFSQQTGVWTPRKDSIEFAPKICKELDEYFQLSEILCGKTITQTLNIEDGRWQFTMENGKPLGLTKKEEKKE